MAAQTLTFDKPSPDSGPVQGVESPYKEFTHCSGSLPFGQPIPLDKISGPTYVTAQSLVQQVAYVLSDRLWTYSPDTFDLDVSVKRWYEEGAANANGYPTTVEPMQIRSGAGHIALGYIFSPDFDLKKRYIPQSIIATSSGLRYLRAALDQLSLLYSVASPFVAHVAAVDYVGGKSPRLVTDYVSLLSMADELGLAVVSSSSAHESQHMSLFATVLASFVPTIHLYDGLHLSRETTRVIDVLDQTGLHKAYQALRSEIANLGNKSKNLDNKVSQVLAALNGELGTDYKLFEYHGHPAPESVLVAFGTVETSLASQVAQSLQRDGVKVGVINVRVYRPFVEDEFIKALPKSTKSIGVLGQVKNKHAVSDIGVRSDLYGDVVASLTYSEAWQNPPVFTDIKYPREQVWTPVSIAAAFQLLVPKPLLSPRTSLENTDKDHSLQIVDPAITQQFIFWDTNKSPASNSPIILSQVLSTDSSNNVTVKTEHDNLTQGGVQRTDIRSSKKTVEIAFPVDSADVVYVGDDSLLKNVDVLDGLRYGGNLILRLPGVKDDELEKRLPTEIRKMLSTKSAKLFILNPQAIETISNDADGSILESYLSQLAFIRIAYPDTEAKFIQRLAGINGNLDILQSLAKDLEKALREIEIPEDWKTLHFETEAKKLLSSISINSLVPSSPLEDESPTFLKSWETVAKGLVFKEAYGLKSALRPDLSVKTYTVQVKENRRLTPLTYDRNIFHIEFDLGDSGLKYDIGEALGIHALNDEAEVKAFIEYYKLNPDDIVEVQSRENPQVLENRTVYQALMQNVDIFGRPPKRFYEALAEFADDAAEKKELLSLGGPEGATEFKRRAEVDTVTYADVLLEFPSAHPSFHDIVRIVSPMKRREYSIASCQKVTPTSVALMIVTVGWVDPKGRDRFGQATRYLNSLKLGAPVTVSVKPSVMKLPPKPSQPIIMAGLGTGLAPFRAFAQHRALEKAQGVEIGPVLLYMGSRHQREEYCYGEEWEAYRDAGVITLLGRAFSRDQPQKIYIQDRMRETLADISDALTQEGAFYLCGPTWPVPDVTNVLEEAIAANSKKSGGKRIDTRKEIEKLKDAGRYVLEVY
jgi:sulfite reductase (NADPH) flavoprotein alpha-component